MFARGTNNTINNYHTGWGTPAIIAAIVVASMATLVVSNALAGGAMLAGVGKLALDNMPAEDEK